MLFDLHRTLAWDEAVYLAEVHADVEPIGYGAHRSRGIILLVAPVAILGPPVWGVRLFLITASSAAMFAAFQAWRPILGPALPLAALLFGSAWLSLFYGSELSPNLWAAFGAVAAVGMIGRWLQRCCGPHLIAITLTLGVVGIIRPIDATLIGGATLAVVLATRSAMWWRMVTAISLGMVLVWLPWIIEAQLMWGGILERLHAAQQVFEGRLAGNVMLEHLSLTDGPLIGPEPQVSIPVMGMLWWTALIAFSALGGLAAKEGYQRRAVTLAIVGGGLIASFYLAFGGALAPRFLLPAYALLSVTSALGIYRGVRMLDYPVRIGSTAIILATVVAWQFWNISVASRIEASQVESRAQAEVLAEVLQDLSMPDDNCRFASQYAWPQIQFYSGCNGSRYVSDMALPFEAPRGGGDFVLTRIPPEDADLQPGQWDGREIRRGSLSGWFVYVPRQASSAGNHE